MVVGTGKATDTIEAVAVKDVVLVEENVVVILIAHTTPGMVLTSKRYIRILAVPIGMPFRGAVERMLAVNVSMERLAADALMTGRVGDVAVAEEGRFQKLILIRLAPAVEDVSA